MGGVMAVTEEYFLDSQKIGEMEEKRIADLNDANIDETEVLEKARDDLTLWDGYFNENVTRGKDDANFVLRDQWTAVERSEFTRLFKVPMTFNRLYDQTKKIAGEQRKNKPDLIVRSLTGRATQEQIDLRADLVRTISYQSQNDLIYQTAFRSALYTGWGAFDIDIEYENPRSFFKVLRFNLIQDATHASFDPTAVKPHKGDGNFFSRRFVYRKDEFYATFPHIVDPVSYSDPRSLLDFQWETRDTIVVCKYARKEWYPLKIYKLSNGHSVTEDEWEEMQKQFALVKETADKALVVGGMITRDLPKIRSERNTQDYYIRQYKLTQNKVIEFMDWPSKYLPGIFVDGDSNFIQGQQYTKSFIHEARDAQKSLNYMGSEAITELKNRRREQWIGTPDNILGYEQLWRNPELQNGILLARPDPKTGQMPTKMPAWELSQSLLQQYMRCTQDIKEILGVSEVDQLQGRDVSGKSRRERKLETSMSAYIFFDNLNQAIEQAGRVVLDLLPAVYGDDDRHMIISKKDGKTASVVLNEILPDGTKANALEKGEYDIEIDTGPSFAVQKDVALEFFNQMIGTNPQVFPLIADLWAGQLDLQQMPQIKERLTNLVPPQIIAKEEGKQMPPQPPSPQEQMMKMQQQAHMQEMQLKQAQIQERAHELMIRQKKHELEEAELKLEAKKLGIDSMMKEKEHGLNLAKADMDYTAKMANILADLHKSSIEPKKPHHSS